MRRFRFFTVPWVGRSGITSFRLAVAVLKRARCTDVVHVHASRDFVCMMTMAICRLTRTPYVTQTHGMVVKSRHPLKWLVDTFALVPLLRGARLNYALQESESRDLLALGLRKSRLRTLPNGIVVDGLPSWRPTTPPVVLFVAGLRPTKRVLTFASMAQMLLADGTDAVFEIVGPDEGDLARLAPALADPAVAGRLTYRGEKSHSETLQALSMATVYVLPSKYDPFPMSLLEALAVGTPAVCTSDCGIADLLLKGSAALVTSREPEDLVRAVQSLLEDVSLQRSLSRAGQRLVTVDLSINSTITQLERDYAAAGTRRPLGLAPTGGAG